MHFMLSVVLAATAGSPGALGNEELAAVVVKKQATWEQCFEFKRADDPLFLTTLQVRLTIAANGKVTGATVENDQVGGDVGACIVDGVKQLRFPARLVPTESPYVFRFKPPNQKASYEKSQVLYRVFSSLMVNCRATPNGSFLDTTITVEPDGQVSSMVTHQTDLDAATAKCVVERAEGMTLPAYKAPVMREMKLNLKFVR